MNKKQRMENLVKELNKASELYYNGGTSPLSDAEFDAKLEELERLEDELNLVSPGSPTVNVGTLPASEIKAIFISGKPMLSLEKVHSAEEILDFYDGYDMAVSVKCDGMSVRLIYEDGKLISANTRGNGTIGQDISEHAKHFLNIPQTIEKKGRYVIDGEAVILDSDFALINEGREKKFKNSRNLASGSLNLLDMSIVDTRRLSFIAWDVIEGGKANEFHYNLEEAKELGFFIVPFFILDCTSVIEKEIDRMNKEVLELAKEKGIPCDGVVWKINDIKAGDTKGRTMHHWRNAVAWKPARKEYETSLVNIELSLGRTGQLTPVAIYKPVLIDGSECIKASLHNISVLIDILGAYPYRGQRIKIYKANEIIPQICWADKDISGVEEEHFIYDRTESIVCPVCGQPIEIKEKDGIMTAWCVNDKCDGKLINRLDHYLGIKGLNVKGVSKHTLSKLIEWGWINELEDIYRLESHRTDWESKPGFGKASVSKILDSINAAGKFTTLERFISALGIPLVGTSASKTIVEKYPNWDLFRKAVGGDWETLEGFGPEISKAINTFDYSEADNIVKRITFKEEEKVEKTNSLARLVFCTTGKTFIFKNRNEMKNFIESQGGKLVGTISSKVDYLITNTPESGTQKNKDAQKLNIPIITEEDFVKKFGQNR